MGITSTIQTFPAPNPVPSWDTVSTSAADSGLQFRVAKWMRGGWIVAGDSGAAATSPDGINWTARSIVSADLKGADSNGTTWAVCGNNNTVFSASASNLASWTSRTPGITGNVLDILWDGTRWIAVGGDSSTSAGAPRIRHSTDLVTWSSGFTSPSVSTTFSAIAVNSDSSYYVAVMSDPSADYVTSTNGTTWSARTGIGASMAQAWDVIWNGTEFVIAGIKGSGSSWAIVIRTLTTGGVLTTRFDGANGGGEFFSQAQPRLVFDGKNHYCFVTSGVYKFSPNWNSVFTPAGVPPYRNNGGFAPWGVDFANSKWIGAGTQGTILFGDAPRYLG